jgi:hypothetical protein
MAKTRWRLKIVWYWVGRFQLKSTIQIPEMFSFLMLTVVQNSLDPKFPSPLEAINFVDVENGSMEFEAIIASSICHVLKCS